MELIINYPKPLKIEVSFDISFDFLNLNFFKKTLDTSSILFEAFEQNQNSVFTFYMKDGRKVTGLIRGYFREDNSEIWQWTLVPSSNPIPQSAIISSEAIYLKHKCILKVKVHNTRSIIFC